MEGILVNEVTNNENGWVFEVRVGDGDRYIDYTVTLSRNYWQELGQPDPAKLMKKSFEFLLAREPKESILREFDLPVIQHYFEEYEEEIKQAIDS